jgi:phosphatidylethanolamine/phosphatidyl-N-methylethanolamine N-methyltransferase
MANVFASYMHFLWAGLVKQAQTGGIVPSQRFLVQKMIAPVPEGYTGQIIELGAGTGALTSRLAARCPGARILACEINPTLARTTRHHLASVGLSDRVDVIAGSAENLLAPMGRSGAKKPDFVISGVPLANLDGKETVGLIDLIREALADGGWYIQFQHSLLDRKRISARFANLHTAPVFLNFPPAFVYYARKS